MLNASSLSPGELGTFTRIKSSLEEEIKDLKKCRQLTVRRLKKSAAGQATYKQHKHNQALFSIVYLRT
jgi:hypothetical protein